MKDIYIVLAELAKENRHILSTWRALLLLRRVADPFYTEDKANAVVRKLVREGLAEPIQGRGNTLFKVTSPYAQETVNIYELTNEAYPAAMLAYSSALEVHRLSDQRSKKIHFFEGPYDSGEIVRKTVRSENAANETDTLLPPGTSASDWRMVSLPRNVRLRAYNGFKLKPHSIKEKWFFGSVIVEYEGVGVRCTDVERTLVEGLRYPKYAGGLSEVFRGWVRAGRVSAQKIVEYTERFDQNILYQRVGFVMEAMGIYHRNLIKWKKEKAIRGGSRVLNPEAEYSPNYSDDWNLSINHPVSIIVNKDDMYS